MGGGLRLHHVIINKFRLKSTIGVIAAEIGRQFAQHATTSVGKIVVVPFGVIDRLAATAVPLSGFFGATTDGRVTGELWTNSMQFQQA